MPEDARWLNFDTRQENPMVCSERHPMILLVDDSAEARQMYALYFDGVGCPTDQAGHGFEAFDKALKQHPDAIVMDLRMPKLDGWEAVRLLKNRAQTRDIPIVALTGDDDLEHLKLAKNAGCDAVLLKPCPPDQVHAVILRLIGERETARTV